MRKQLYLTTILLLLFYATANAQTPCSLKITSLQNPGGLKTLHYKKTVVSSEEGDTELQKVLKQCYNNGYLTAYYDSIYKDSVSIAAQLNTGKQYRWIYLEKGNVDEGVLSEIRFKELFYKNKPFHYSDVVNIQEQIITYYENNGFPFASIKLDSISISDSSIAAQLYINKNNETHIDSILLTGTSKLSMIYLQKYIGIKQGDLYNESKIKNINTRIDELAFVSTVNPARVIFSHTNTKLILHINKKQASRFDGIVGIMSDQKNQKTYFTGDLHLMLQNGLNKGELIDLNWRRLQSQTQDLKIRLVYPYLFKLPFGIDYNFKLYKRDTTFLDVNHNIGLQYLLTGGNYFKLFYTNQTSTLLSTYGMDNITQLPPYADISTNMYGIGVKYEKLDYRLNPRKGYFISANSSVGVKTIHKNNKLNALVYDNLNLSTTQYNGDLNIGVFIPIKKISTFKVEMKSAFIQGKNIFKNELFRIGGLKTLRGFNEEELFASAYSIISLEYRLLLEKNSYLYVFSDGAYYENQSVADKIHDTPIGFGSGISFETKAGIFSISYALGKQFNNPIELRNGKIHFGLINYF